eukprot:TRINITY_DN9315_c1_g1_i2.p1 TRINITY_DN9315_c1_g1~~TRINITY_DN9315_c1_g1_i2.p1  ORF type:complete len:275 (+),score=35.30 TRINITY_DN9315_c1_g1_i2:143-967(+)
MLYLPKSKWWRTTAFAKGSTRTIHVSSSSTEARQKYHTSSMSNMWKDRTHCERMLASIQSCLHLRKYSTSTSSISSAIQLTIMDPQDATWYPDTGASVHMTSGAGNLKNLKPYFGNDTIMVGNATQLSISHIRDAQLNFGSTSIDVPDALLIPEIMKNLLSVSQLTSEFPCTFEFSSDGFVIKEQRKGKILAKGSMKEGLYALDDNKKVAEALFSIRNRRTSENIWHKRLGHPQSGVVRFLNSQDFISLIIGTLSILFVVVVKWTKGVDFLSLK